MARLPTPKREDLPAEQQPVYDSIVASRGQLQGPFTALIYSPTVAGRVAEVGAYIRFESTLPVAVRCLAALMTAREFDCTYEWAAWAPQAQQAGISDEVIAAIHDRRSPGGLSNEHALVVKAAEQLLRGNHHLSDDTYRALIDTFGPQGAVEITATIGYFALLAMPLNAFEVDAPAGRPRLSI